MGRREGIDGIVNKLGQTLPGLEIDHSEHSEYAWCRVQVDRLAICHSAPPFPFGRVSPPADPMVCAATSCGS